MRKLNWQVAFSVSVSGFAFIWLGIHANSQSYPPSNGNMNSNSNANSNTSGPPAAPTVIGPHLLVTPGPIPCSTPLGAASFCSCNCDVNTNSNTSSDRTCEVAAESEEDCPAVGDACPGASDLVVKSCTFNSDP